MIDCWHTFRQTDSNFCWRRREGNLADRSRRRRRGQDGGSLLGDRPQDLRAGSFVDQSLGAEPGDLARSDRQIMQQTAIGGGRSGPPARGANEFATDETALGAFDGPWVTRPRCITRLTAQRAEGSRPSDPEQVPDGRKDDHQHHHRDEQTKPFHASAPVCTRTKSRTECDHSAPWLSTPQNHPGFRA
ncbi:MAG: hypothetical protein AMXMBFR13_03570 [Phycisphaerae bacterium]